MVGSRWWRRADQRAVIIDYLGESRTVKKARRRQARPLPTNPRDPMRDDSNPYYLIDESALLRNRVIDQVREQAGVAYCWRAKCSRPGRCST